MFFRKLELDCNCFLYDSPRETSWESHFRQYVTAYNCLIQSILLKHVKINEISRPLLFLMRHIIELMLKKESVENGEGIQSSHSLTLLSQGTDHCDFVDSLSSVLYCDEEGDRFRYAENNPGELYVYPKEVCCLNEIKTLVDYLKINFGLEQNMPIELSDKKLRWMFTMHQLEICCDGQIRTQYDNAIYCICNLIQQGKISLRDVYCPLLFLIKHSIELGLKDNLSDVKSFTGLDLPLFEFSNEHCINKIFESVEKLVKACLDQLKDVDSIMCQQATGYLENLNKIKQNIQIVNPNSKNDPLRFPSTKRNNPLVFRLDGQDLVSIINSLIYSDTFLTIGLGGICETLGQETMIDICQNINNSNNENYLNNYVGGNDDSASNDELLVK